MFRVYVDPHRQSSEIAKTSMVVETHRRVVVDFSAAATDKSTTVSSVAWSSEGSRAITFSDTSLTSGVAEADMYSDNSGWGVVKAKATYANSQTESQFINVRIDDPEYRLNTI